jgi:hypothetical protein
MKTPPQKKFKLQLTGLEKKAELLTLKEKQSFNCYFFFISFNLVKYMFYFPLQHLHVTTVTPLPYPIPWAEEQRKN